MIEIIRGDMFEYDVEAMVNTVNCVGTWGKGVALEFKKRFPQCFETHKIACAAGLVNVGKMHICEHLFPPRYVINFPTKIHWKDPSKIEWIDSGLADLTNIVWSAGIESITIPALGCGNGGLRFEGEVLPLMLKHLHTLKEVDIKIFYPRTQWAR